MSNWWEAYPVVSADDPGLQAVLPPQSEPNTDANWWEAYPAVRADVGAKAVLDGIEADKKRKEEQAKLHEAHQSLETYGEAAHVAGQIVTDTTSLVRRLFGQNEKADQLNRDSDVLSQAMAERDATRWRSEEDPGAIDVQLQDNLRREQEILADKNLDDTQKSELISKLVGERQLLESERMTLLDRAGQYVPFAKQGVRGAARSLGSSVLGAKGAGGLIGTSRVAAGAATGAVRGAAARGVAGVASGAAQGAGAAARGVAAGGSAYGAIALASGQEANQAMTEGADAGLTGSALTSYAASQGIIEAVPATVMQRLGLGGVEAMVAGPAIRGGIKAGFMEAIKRIGQELPEEVAMTEVPHAIAREFAGVDPRALDPDNLSSLVADTVLQTVLMGAGVGAVNTVLGAAQDRLARLQEIRAKGFVSAEDAAKEGIAGKNRKERMANTVAEIEQLSKEASTPKGGIVPTVGTTGLSGGEQPGTTQGPPPLPGQPPRLPGPAGAAETPSPGNTPTSPLVTQSVIQQLIKNAAAQGTGEQSTQPPAATQPSASQPGASQPEGEPPIAEGMTRLYHGSATPGRTEGKAYFSTNRPYAENYRGKDTSELQYVDVPTKWVNEQIDPDNYGQTVERGFTWNGELDSSFTGPRKILTSPPATPAATQSTTKPTEQPKPSQPSNPDWDVIEVDGKLFRQNPNAKTNQERISTRQPVDPSEGTVLVTKDKFGNPIPPKALAVRQEFVAKAQPGAEFEHKDYPGQSFKVLEDGKLLNSSGRKMGDIQTMANTLSPGKITWKETPSTAGSSEETGKTPTVPSTVSSDAPSTPETSMGETGGVKQTSEARADQPRRGQVGDMLAAGEVVTTSSGRQTTPFPNIDTSSDRKAQNTIKRVDKWLHENAVEEARSRGDDFNLTQFENEDPANLPPASKDLMEEYLFGEQPKVIPKPTKPLVSPAPTSTARPTTSAAEQVPPKKTGKKPPQLAPGVVAEVDGKGQVGIVESVTQDGVTLVFDGNERETFAPERLTTEGWQDAYTEDEKQAVVQAGGIDQALGSFKKSYGVEATLTPEDKLSDDHREALDFAKSRGQRLAFVDIAKSETAPVASFNPETKIALVSSELKGDKLWGMIGHEMAHRTGLDSILPTDSSELQSMMDEYYQTASPAYRARLDKDKQQHEREGRARLVQKFFEDKAFRDKLKQDNPTMWDKLREAVLKFIGKWAPKDEAKRLVLDELRAVKKTGKKQPSEMTDAEKDAEVDKLFGELSKPPTTKEQAPQENLSEDKKSSVPATGADLEAMIEAEFDAQLGTAKRKGKKLRQGDTFTDRKTGKQFTVSEVIHKNWGLAPVSEYEVALVNLNDGGWVDEIGNRRVILEKMTMAGMSAEPDKSTGKKQPAKPPAQKKTGLRKAADTARKEADDLWAELRQQAKNKLNKPSMNLDAELAAIAVRVALAEIKANTLTFAAFVEQAVSKVPADMLDSLKPYMEVAWKVAHKRGMTNDPGGKFDDVLAKGNSDETRTGTDGNERVEDGTRQPDGNAPAASDRTDGSGEAENDTGQPSDQLLPDSRPAKGDKRGRGRKGNGTDGRSNASESQPGQGDATDSGTRGDDGTVDERLAVDHVIEQDDDLAVSSLTTSLARNINALEILKSLETDGRFPNEGERKALAQYTGWGGLSQALDSIKGERMLGDKDWLRDPNWEKQWGKAYLKLKELLTKEEMQAAQDSTENAHYTSKPVIQSLWKIAERLGYQGGRVLELGAGIGHFAGLMPSNVRGSTKFIMVEMDSVSSRIAKMLYPNHEVFATDMAEFKAVPGSVTMGIGNVPFAGGSIADAERRYGVELNLHNYAFARHLDAVAPGGIVVAISTHKTLDANIKQRQFLSTKGDLIGAIRLPNNAFAENAKTEVVTDILIFRRPRQGEPKVGVRIDQNADVTVKTNDGRDVVRSINKYFIDNPHMVLGTHSAKGSMYGPDEYTLESTPGDLQAKINAAIESLPLNMLGQVEVAEQVVSTDKSVPFGRLEIHDGKVVMGYGDKFVELNGQRFEGFPVHLTGKTGISRAKDYIELRDQLASVRNIMLDETASDEDVKREQKKLGKAYDRYVEKHGPLNAPKTNIFVRDPDYYRVMALENERSEYNPDTKKIEVTYGKAAIFTERVLGPQKEPESAASPADAMSLSIAWRGAINADFIGKLLGVTAKEAEAKLLDEGLAFRNPTTTELELADLYLSGNVRTKLAQAEISASEDPQYQRNVDALKKVLPEPVTLKKDTVRLGAAWIPENVINAFASQAFGTEVSVTYNANTDAWTVGPVSSVSDAAKAKYKTGRVDPEEILAEVLNLRSIKVYDRVETGEYTQAGKPKTTQVLNEKETQAAKHRASVMRADFDKWVMESPDVSRLLAKLYNEKYNNFVRTKYNGDFLVLPGANPEVKLRPYQKNAIWRILNRGTSLLAHAVGSGKTYTMIGAAMEMRRLGLARRPVLVVQNATLGQFATSFQKMYPNANILVANKDDLGKGKRQLFLNKISTGNWDAVVMAQSTFDNMASDPAVERAFIQDQLDLLEEAIREEGGENAKTPTVKQLVRTKKALKKRFDKLIGSRAKKQDNVTFEDLGADALFLDEAHAYKKPMFTTKLTQLVGLNTEASARSIATTIKVRSIQTAHNGRNVILATGTPVTNTLGEAWHMVNYVSPATNASFSSRTFDQFVGNFAQVEPTLTMNAGGKYVYKDAIVKFRNGHQLVEYINDSWDIVTPDQLRAYMESTSKGFPKLRNGQPTAITVDRTPGVANFMDFIERVYDRFKALPAKERRAMSFIPALAYGASKAATLDIRLVNPNAAEEKDSKLQKAADEIKRIYDESMDTKGTQLFFSDMKNQFSMTRLQQFMGGETIDAFEEDSGDTADADSESGEETEAVEVDDNESESFLYQELRKKLLAQGIPAEQIAFVADAKTDQQRQTLFERVNNGDIRVLIGSTAKMGVGVNVQKKLVALHHFDTPWLPADLEQREGRILRFGNENETVDIIRYAMKKTLDGAIYMATARKQKFIWQVLNGQLDGDSFEDPSSAAMLSIEEQLAAIQDDPIFFEKIEVQNRLRELELERQSFYDAQQRLADSLANTKSNLNYLESRSLPKWKDRADRIQKLQDDGELSKFSLTHGKQTFTDPKQAAEYIKAKVEEVRAYILKNWDSARTFYQVDGGLLGMPAKQKVQFTVGPAGVVIAAQPAFVTETNAEGKEVTKSSVKFKSVAYLEEPDGVYEFYDGTATVPQTFFDKAQTILDETKQDISTGMRRVEEYTAKIGELEKLLEKQWEDQEEYDQKKARLAAIEQQMLSSEGSLASGKKKSKDKTPKTITKRGQYVLPDMPGMVEDIDRQDFVRKYLDRALEPLWGWSSNPDDEIEIQEAIDTMSPHVAALMNEIYAGKFIDSYAARESQAYATAITAAARTDMDALITDSLDKAIDQAVAESPEQPEVDGDEDSQNISVDVLRTRGSGTPQQASQSPFSATEGETKEGKRLLAKMKRDSLKRKIGPRSIMNFLKDIVRVASIEGKSQLSRRNPGHYKPREHLVRSRTGASGVLDTHEAGHALSALLRDKDKRILARHEAGLIALTQMPNSMASGQTAEEGIAEFVRRYIVDYQSLPKALVADLEADIAKVSPELLAGLKDTNRLWQQFLARPLQERLDASKNDRAPRRSGRGFRDAVYRSLYNLIGGDVAIHKVRRELERPLFQFSQEMGRQFREMATDTQADIDNAYQSVIRVPVETQRAIFGDSRSDKQGVSIIAFGDNMFSEDTIDYLRDGGFSVPDEFKHGERVYLTNQSFEQIRQKLGDDWDAFENYGQLRASLERAVKKGHQTAWMHENISIQEAAAAIDAMEKEHPTWIGHFDEVREFFDGLLLVATLSGEHTPEEAVRIRNAWDSYWPLLRQVTPEESGRVGRAGPDPSAGIHLAFGSALPVRNLLEAVELRTKAAMQAYYTNRMMLAMRKYSDTLHSMKEAPFDIRKAGARLMVPLKMDLQKVASLSPMEQAQMILDYMNKQLQHEAEANGEDFEPLTLEDIDISMPWKPIFRAKRPGAVQVIGLTENGDRKYYQVTDPLLFDLMSNSGSMSRYATWLARFFAKGIGPWKRALTQNLAFAVRNLPRDTVTALTMGESGKSFVPGAFLAYGIVGRLNGSLGQDAPARAELFSRSLESLHRPRHKKVWDSFVEAATEGIVIPGYWDMNFYDRVSEAPGQLSAVALWPVTMFNWATGGRYVAQMSEELQREGAFLEARGRGKSYEYAQRQYDQISGNFSQKQPNHATATFIRSAGFLNPGLQIMWGQMKRWHDPDPRAQKLYLAKLPALAAWFSVASAINVALVYALFGDDEEKLDEVLNDMRERPDYEKDTTMSVMGTVRLPFEYGLSGAVSSFAWNATQDSLLGGSNETIPTRLKAFLARATQIPGPTDAIHPYLKTAIELQMGEAGYSMYRNDAIVDANLIVQYPVNPELRAYNNTPELFKQIGERLKVSPLKVEYAVGSLFTGTAQDLLSLASKIGSGKSLKAEDVPVMSRLVQRESTGFRSQAVRELRKASQEVEALATKIKKMGDAAPSELRDQYAKLHEASLAYNIVSDMYDTVKDEVEADQTNHDVVEKTERKMTHFARQFLDYRAGKAQPPEQLKTRKHEYYGLQAYHATGNPESETGRETQEKGRAMIELSGMTIVEAKKALIDHWQRPDKSGKKNPTHETKQGSYVMKPELKARLDKLEQLFKAK